MTKNETETKNMKKVLVVDDEKTTLAIVEAILEDNGYSVIVALNGTEGLMKARSHQPDAIVLDRQMPKMDGNQTLIELKADETICDIPVIMLTGTNRVSDVSCCLELGAVDYIVKPFDADNFLIRLNKAIQDRK